MIGVEAEAVDEIAASTSLILTHNFLGVEVGLRFFFICS